MSKYSNTYSKGSATKSLGVNLMNVNTDVTGGGKKSIGTEPVSKPSTHEDLRLQKIKGA